MGHSLAAGRWRMFLRCGVSYQNRDLPVDGPCRRVPAWMRVAASRSAAGVDTA